MKSGIIKYAKIFFIVALVLIVAGMTMLGIFNFNQSVDYKNSYEMQISVDQNVGTSVQTMKNSAEKFFSDNGIAPVSYATQTMNDGATVVYKFNWDVSAKVGELKTAVKAALDADTSFTGVGVDVEFYVLGGDNASQVGKVVLALGVFAVIIFLYALIVEKLAGATATIFSSLLASVLFVSMINLVRIPALPFVSVTTALSALLAATLSVATVNKYRELVKLSDGKANLTQIVDKASKSALLIYVFVCAALIVAAALFVGILGWVSYLFLALQIVVAALCGTASAYFATPFMWVVIKQSKKK